MRAFIQNIGKYNEGEIKGGWLDLPTSKESIDSFLREQVGLQLSEKEGRELINKTGRVYEEYMIADVETKLDCYNTSNEYTDIHQLNLLAAYENQAENIEAINEYCNRANVDSPIGICNVIAQEDNLDIISMPEYCSSLSSDNEKIGYTFGQNIEEKFEKAGLSELAMYFDYEMYGRDIALNAKLTVIDDTILNISSSDIKSDLYSFDELYTVINNSLPTDKSVQKNHNEAINSPDAKKKPETSLGKDKNTKPPMKEQIAKARQQAQQMNMHHKQVSSLNRGKSR